MRRTSVCTFCAVRWYLSAQTSRQRTSATLKSHRSLWSGVSSQGHVATTSYKRSSQVVRRYPIHADARLNRNTVWGLSPSSRSSSPLRASISPQQLVSSLAFHTTSRINYSQAVDEVVVPEDSKLKSEAEE
ncbi:hypothetical protein HK102_006941, partial [Quaeritorhiza haematococci]